jgi:outer membrane protein assembly factor BamD
MQMTFNKINVLQQRGLICGLAVVLLMGCTENKLRRAIDDNVTVDANETPKSLYKKAASRMRTKSYKSAANSFAFVQEQFPYSQYALKAQIMEGFCRYHAHQYEDAIDLFTIFSKLHPRHEDAPYALYMIGLCHYERTSIVERDQTDAYKAQKAFRKVCKLFPTCKYAKDAQFKIDFLNNHLAAQEMAVGRYYLRCKAFIAAINRFKNVIVKYETTEQRPEALLRLAECYATLNLKDEFLATYEVLKLNHPDSEWLQIAETILKRVESGQLLKSIKASKQFSRKATKMSGLPGSKGYPDDKNKNEFGNKQTQDAVPPQEPAPMQDTAHTQKFEELPTLEQETEPPQKAPLVE